MKRVITYGTFDLLHYGHIRLLERAKALGDYLIVGVTSDDSDRTRGKINNQQSLMERIAAVRETNLADEIIVEEYEGQKINDIQKYHIDVFTVGSDWDGFFDYLRNYCQVIYLPRTEGISSSGVRSERRRIRIGIIGDTSIREKFAREAKYVNGAEITGVYSIEPSPVLSSYLQANNEDELLKEVDALYVVSKPEEHYAHVKMALENGKHVLCEAPIAQTKDEAKELYALAKDKHLILMSGIKTAYSTAYARMILLAKSGIIGDIVSIDSVCTSLKDEIDRDDADLSKKWNSVCAWGPVAMLPVFDIFGVDYSNVSFRTRFRDRVANMDAFTKIDFLYPSGVASARVAKGAKAEGELVIAGTEGYIYVPAPWWKTDYFEVRYENPEANRRFFYQLDGEGIRYEIAAFSKAVESGKSISYVSEDASVAIAGVVEKFNQRRNMVELQ